MSPLAIFVGPVLASIIGIAVAILLGRRAHSQRQSARAISARLR